MEFRFDLNDIFKGPVVEVGNTLVPPGFTGDKRTLWDTQSKVTQIVNAMGEASAHAQGLSKPITTADRLRNSEHRLYLLIDQDANHGKGAVTGMLKTGEKSLYVFDREGQHYQVSPPCVLDFYIHESRQRSGFGKHLFEHMLHKEQIEPVRMAIDRPSDKFLGFLNKHYGLNTPVKQMNNFVVFDGFFPRASEPMRPTVESDNSNTPSRKQSANGLQQGHPSQPFGRYGARRPPCSMGQIIHNDSAVIKGNQKPTGVRSDPTTSLRPGQPFYSHSDPTGAWQATQSAPTMLHYPPNPYPNQYQSYAMAQGDAPIQQQPFYYNPESGQNYGTNRVPPHQPLTKSREPLIPQSFDGTPRTMPHSSQSQPLRADAPYVPAQSSPSAPVQYYHQQPPQSVPVEANFTTHQMPPQQLSQVPDSGEMESHPQTQPPALLNPQLQTLGGVPPPGMMPQFEPQYVNRVPQIEPQSPQRPTPNPQQQNAHLPLNPQQPNTVPVHKVPSSIVNEAHNPAAMSQYESQHVQQVPSSSVHQHQPQQHSVQPVAGSVSEPVNNNHTLARSYYEPQNTQQVPPETGINSVPPQGATMIAPTRSPSQNTTPQYEPRNLLQQVSIPTTNAVPPQGSPAAQPSQNVQRIPSFMVVPPQANEQRVAGYMAAPPEALHFAKNLPVVNGTGQNQPIENPEMVYNGPTTSNPPENQVQFGRPDERYPDDQPLDVDLSKGYPPQHYQSPATARPPIVVRN